MLTPTQKERSRDRTRAAAHRRRLDSLPAVNPPPDNLSLAAALPQVGQVALPRVGYPADDLPPKAGDPADPLQTGQTPVQLRSDLLFIHPTTPSYSAVARTSPKTLSRSSDQPDSPAGWEAVDPTRAESDSEEELGTPQMLHVWHSSKPVRQMLTRLCPLCLPDHHPPQARQSPSGPSQPPHAPTVSLLHQVIQAVHKRASQSSSNNPSFGTPRKRRQYGNAYSYQQTSNGKIRCVLTSKKQLDRRGGYWDVVGDDYCLDSDQSDSKKEDYATDEDEDNSLGFSSTSEQ